jgi:DNA repair protein RadA/Sms
MSTHSRRDDAHVCSACGRHSARWFGRCPECGEWSTAAGLDARSEGPATLGISSLDRPDRDVERWPTRLDEVDRVLGGGLVAGSAVLLAGEPGIGKSTLVLQLLDGLLRAGRRTLLIGGEESVGQVALRGKRLGVALESFRVASASSIDQILAACELERADVIVVDSIQTLEDPSLEQSAGSVVQVRECAAALVRLAKSTGSAVVLVGHVTKEGAVAGPKTLEHIVDALVTLQGERTGTLRLLRATKNRFGSCEETGVFAMGARGLEVVADPSALLLADRRAGIPGSAVFCGLEGSRPLMVELQALVTESSLMQPRRVPLGVDGRRLALLLGVLRRHAGLKLGNMDVFVSAAGGIAVREPAADLGLCVALMSAAGDRPVPDDLVIMGEVGLGGEVRRVPGIARRLAEAARLGFRRALVPNGTDVAPRGLVVRTASSLTEAVAHATCVSEPAAG